MLRATALLIVMVLGGPTSSFLCELQCADPSAVHHQRTVGCHHASVDLSDGQQIAAARSCHDLVGLEPFVAESRQAQAEGSAMAAVGLHARPTMLRRDLELAESRVFQVYDFHSPFHSAVLRI
jgi:hypothetical protein